MREQYPKKIIRFYRYILKKNITIFIILYSYMKGLIMIEMGISEVQHQFTKLLSKSIMIVDKKSHKKRAVILPYEVYEKLALLERKNKVFEADDELDAFVGLLEGADKLKTEDERYKAIIK